MLDMNKVIRLIVLGLVFSYVLFGKAIIVQSSVKQTNIIQEIHQFLAINPCSTYYLCSNIY